MASITRTASKILGFFRRLKSLGTDENGLARFYDRKSEGIFVKINNKDINLLEKYVNNAIFRKEESKCFILCDETRGIYYVEENLYSSAMEEMFSESVLGERKTNE
jgi:hypothetical protein